MKVHVASEHYSFKNVDLVAIQSSDPLQRAINKLNPKAKTIRKIGCGQFLTFTAFKYTAKLLLFTLLCCDSKNVDPSHLKKYFYHFYLDPFSPFPLCLDDLQIPSGFLF